MFRPRHAYKSPITSRYKGKAKGCPVFNNIVDIDSNMVEQHDECLECLAKIKNRTDLYRTLADNKKPSNNVIKSLQRLSSSASNNRLKTCLQFSIIKVNEKSIATPQQTTATTNIISGSNSPKSHEFKEADQNHLVERALTSVATNKHQNKRQKLLNHPSKQKSQQTNHKRKHNQLASPPQDQVSSTQDQVGPAQDEHDCQTSPMMFVSTQNDDDLSPIQTDEKQFQDDPPSIKGKQNHQEDSPAQKQSSPSLNYSINKPTSTGSSATTTTISAKNTSPSVGEHIDVAAIDSNTTTKNGDAQDRTTCTTSKKRRTHNNSDHDTSSTASWPSSSYASPPSPISTSSTSSMSSSSSHSSSSSSCSSSMSPSPSPSPLSSPDMINELRGARLKLSEEKIRKIKKRPILFDDYFTEHSFVSTPTTSSGCSPGQHSNTTQNSDQSRLGISTNNLVIHMFQAPAKFVNNLKPCNLPTQPQEPPPSSTPPAPTKEMLNCAICGIKDRPPNIGKIYGQNSCLLCTRFFATFLKRPQQLYCAQDGDCLMTFDSRCQACWIKICLQKFDIEEEHRKVGQKYSPKLLSSPNVSLITIDTSSR